MSENFEEKYFYCKNCKTNCTLKLNSISNNYEFYKNYLFEEKNKLININDIIHELQINIDQKDENKNVCEKCFYHPKDRAIYYIPISKKYICGICYENFKKTEELIYFEKYKLKNEDKQNILTDIENLKNHINDLEILKNKIIQKISEVFSNSKKNIELFISFYKSLLELYNLKEKKNQLSFQFIDFIKNIKINNLKESCNNIKKDYFDYFNNITIKKVGVNKFINIEEYKKFLSKEEFLKREKELKKNKFKFDIEKNLNIDFYNIFPENKNISLYNENYYYIFSEYFNDKYIIINNEFRIIKLNEKNKILNVSEFINIHKNNNFDIIKILSNGEIICCFQKENIYKFIFYFINNGTFIENRKIYILFDEKKYNNYYEFIEIDKPNKIILYEKDNNYIFLFDRKTDNKLEVIEKSEILKDKRCFKFKFIIKKLYYLKNSNILIFGVNYPLIYSLLHFQIVCILNENFNFKKIYKLTNNKILLGKYFFNINNYKYINTDEEYKFEGEIIGMWNNQFVEFINNRMKIYCIYGKNIILKKEIILIDYLKDIIKREDFTIRNIYFNELKKEIFLSVVYSQKNLIGIVKLTKKNKSK